MMELERERRLYGEIIQSQKPSIMNDDKKLEKIY